MDDFSQIIGIVLAIIFFAFSALRKKNKQPNQSANTNNISSMLDSFINMESEPEQNEYAENVVEDKTVIENELKSNSKKFIPSKPSVKASIIARKKEKPLRSKDNSTTKSKPKFDLRTAVIHSEILNRKYF